MVHTKSSTASRAGPMVRVRLPASRAIQQEIFTEQPPGAETPTSEPSSRLTRPATSPYYTLSSGAMAPHHTDLCSETRLETFYGATYYGGTGNAGTVFKIDSAGTQTVLHNFTDMPDGANPVAGLIRDAAGYLYGTTAHGGSSGLGTVFRMGPTGTIKLLHTFTGSDGALPYPGLTWASAGTLYGLTNTGGAGGFGVVFKIALSH